MAPSTRSGKVPPEPTTKEPRARGRTRRDPTPNSQEQDTPMQSVESQASTSASTQGHTTDPIHDSSRPTSSTSASTSQQPVANRATSENRATSRYALRSVSRSVSPNRKISQESRSRKRGASDVDGDEEEQPSNSKQPSARRKKQKSTHDDDEDDAEETSTSTHGAHGAHVGRGGRGSRGRGGRAGKGKASAQLQAIEESPAKPQTNPNDFNPWALELQGTTDESVKAKALELQPVGDSAPSPMKVPGTPLQSSLIEAHAFTQIEQPNKVADVQSSISLPSIASGIAPPSLLAEANTSPAQDEQSTAIVVDVQSSIPSPSKVLGIPSLSPHIEANAPLAQVEQSADRVVDVQSSSSSSSESSSEEEPDTPPRLPRLTKTVTAQEVLDMPDPFTGGVPKLYNKNKRKAPDDELDIGYTSLSDSEVPNFDTKTAAFRTAKRRIVNKANNWEETAPDPLNYFSIGKPPGKKRKTIQRETDTSAQRNSTSASPTYTLTFPVHSSKSDLVVTNPNLIDSLRALAEWGSDPSNTLPTPEEIMNFRQTIPQVVPPQATSTQVTLPQAALPQATSPQATSGTYTVPYDSDSESSDGIEDRSPLNNVSTLKKLVVDRSISKPLFTVPETPKGGWNPSQGWFSTIKKVGSKVSSKLFGQPDDTPIAPPSKTPISDLTFQPVQNVPREFPQNLPITPGLKPRAAERMPQTVPARPHTAHTQSTHTQSTHTRSTHTRSTHTRSTPREPRLERIKKRREENKNVLAAKKAMRMGLRLTLKNPSPKKKMGGAERVQIAVLTEWSDDEDEGETPRPRDTNLMSREDLKELRAQKLEARRIHRQGEEARVADEEHNHGRTYGLSYSSSNDEDEECSSNQDDGNQDDGNQDDGNASPSENAAPVLVCPPRPERDWENDDRYGFTAKRFNLGSKLTRFDRLTWREAKTFGKNAKIHLALPKEVSRIPKQHDKYIDMTVHVEVWAKEVEKWEELSAAIEEGRAAQGDIDEYNSMIQSNLEIVAKPPPVASAIFATKYAPKTPSRLRHSENAYSSPIYDDEEDIQGSTSLDVSDTLVELVNAAEVHAPLRPLPVPTKTDLVDCPAWVVDI